MAVTTRIFKSTSLVRTVSFAKTWTVCFSRRQLLDGLLFRPIEVEFPMMIIVTALNARAYRKRSVHRGSVSAIFLSSLRQVKHGRLELMMRTRQRSENGEQLLRCLKFPISSLESLAIGLDYFTPSVL